MPSIGADVSTRTMVLIDDALPARSTPRSVKRWQPSARPLTGKVPDPGTSVPASKVPHVPADIGAKARVRMLVPMPMFASVYAVRPDTVTVPVVLVVVGVAPLAAAPLTVTAPPVGATPSTRTVTWTAALSPAALTPTRS